MCAGEESAFKKVKPILDKLSDGGKLLALRRRGGKGAQVKALVNMVIKHQHRRAGEGLCAWGTRWAGLAMLPRNIFADGRELARVADGGRTCRQNREHSCFFSAAHAAKDSGIALNLAKRKRSARPLARPRRNIRPNGKEGLGELDKSASRN